MDPHHDGTAVPGNSSPNDAKPSSVFGPKLTICFWCNSPITHGSIHTQACWQCDRLFVRLEKVRREFGASWATMLKMSAVHLAEEER